MTDKQHCGHEGVCAGEDFCKGCDNFDVFFNSCKLTFYKTSIGGKKETIHPVTNHSRWLLAVVGCASDTRTHPIDLSTVPKMAMVEELAKREGVTMHDITAGEKYVVESQFQELLSGGSGPAQILVVKDDE